MSKGFAANFMVIDLAFHYLGTKINSRNKEHS